MAITTRKLAVRTLAGVAVLAAMAMATGCSPKDPAWHNADGSTPGKAVDAVSVTAPTNGATDVPTSTEIALGNLGDGAATVTFADSAGAPVEGSLRPDRTAWVPATQLKYSTGYTATVTAPGKQETKVSFTTMAKPGKLVSVSTAISDGRTYGVALPIVVRFGAKVATDQRANVEKRLFVTSEPAQLGVWHWFSGDEVHYRPKEYWQEGTKLSVRLATGGLPLGGTAHGAKDVTIKATIGEKIVMTTDDATHMMTVTQRDQVIRTIPISLGKASTPSSSGAMVIMTKNESEEFVSTDPKDPYRLTVQWAQRTTIGGEYLHAAPWSVGDQGKRNVSHGCTNLSNENAKWLYGITHIGDPVVVKGTPRKLEWGNGWSDWDRSWDEYVKGSALPPPAAPAQPSQPAAAG